MTDDEVADERRRAEQGRWVSVLASCGGDGVVASGLSQRVDDVVEIVGVATLPTARHRGFGAAVTAALARRALETGAGLVFLSAGSTDIARVYERVGSRRVGTACIAQPSR